MLATRETTRPQDARSPRGHGHATPLPPTLFFGALIAQVALHLAAPLARIVPQPWNLLGSVLVAIGLAVAVIADQQFKRARTPIRPGDTPTVLVTDGAFAFSRNPMYLGLVLVLIGTATMLATLTPFALAPLFGWLMSARFVRTEEAMLEATFGEAYESYARRVRRWL